MSGSFFYHGLRGEFNPDAGGRSLKRPAQVRQSGTTMHPASLHQPPTVSLRVAAALAAAFSTVVLVWFGNDLQPWWPLMWFAPLPVLLFAAGSRSRWSAAVVAFAAWFAGSACMWRYFQALHRPLGDWAVTYALVSLIFTGAVLLFRALLRRGRPWSALVAFPAAWVTGEFAASRLTSGGTAGSLAYTQLEFLPYLQLASLTGPTGMSFGLLLFSAALALGWHRRRAQGWRFAAAGVGVIALALVFGTVRLAGPSDAPRAQMGLITSDAPDNVFPPDDDAGTERLLRAYAAGAEALIARGAQVVVMPEKLAVAAEPLGAFDNILQPVADKTGATLVVGLVRVAGPAQRSNQARVYTPGSPVQTYDKQHLLPPMESNMQPGTALTLLPQPAAGSAWGVAVCKDLDFTGLARRYGRAGAGALLVPGWDFDLDRRWHGHIAVMRGVENGFSVVRAAKNGYLTVSDDRGRILAEARSDAAPFVTLVADTPSAHHATLYERGGDWFAWLAVAILVFSLVRRFGKVPPDTSDPTVFATPSGPVRRPDDSPAGSPVGVGGRPPNS